MSGEPLFDWFETQVSQHQRTIHRTYSPIMSFQVLTSIGIM